MFAVPDSHVFFLGAASTGSTGPQQRPAAAAGGGLEAAPLSGTSTGGGDLRRAADPVAAWPRPVSLDGEIS